MTALGERLAPMAEAARNAPSGLPWTSAHVAYIAHFPPAFAAALVAVAEAADGLEDCPFCRLPQGVHRDACPLGRLAKTLGVP